MPARTIEVHDHEQLVAAIDHGMSQIGITTYRDLADRASVSSEWLSNLRNRRRDRVGAAELERLSSALGWPDDLLARVAAGDLQVPDDLPPQKVDDVGTSEERLERLEERIEELDGALDEIRRLLRRLSGP